MIVKDSHFTHFTHFILAFKSSILVQMVIYFSNTSSSSIPKDIILLLLSLSPFLTLNILTYPLVLDNIKIVVL